MAVLDVISHLICAEMRQGKHIAKFGSVAEGVVIHLTDVVLSIAIAELGNAVAS